MKLVSLKIDTFGGISDFHIRFNPQFTVIQGPNEAGKSTLFNALINLLLTDVHLTKPVFKKNMQRFLPLASGDTIGAELAFHHEEESFTLRKRWGGETSVQLILPEGAQITDEKEVKKRLQEMLPSGEGTVRHVFLTRQSGLGDTLERLSEDQEVLFSFSDLLKKAVLETGGISLAKFEGSLTELYDSYFKRWDRVKQFPEGGRGFHNPYKAGLGHIVSAYYDVEKLKSRLIDAQSKESEYEECEKEYEEEDRKLSEVEAFLMEQAALYQQAREGVRIEGELAQINAQAKLLKTDHERWPIAEVELQNNEKERASAAQAFSGIKKEREKAEHVENHRKLADKYKRVLKKKKILQEKQELLAPLKPVEPALLKEIRSLEADLQRLKGVFSSQALNVNIEAKNPASFSFSTGGGTSDENVVLKAGENRVLKGAGQVKLESDDWVLEISAGDEEAQRAEQDYRKKKKREGEILSTYSAGDLAELEHLSRVYEKAVQEVHSGEENLESELEGTTFESLAAEIEKGGLDEKTRPLPEIIEEAVRLEKREETIGNDIARLEAEQSELKKKYKDKETLFQSMIESQVRKKELEEALPGVDNLPKGAEDFPAFIQLYEDKQKERDILKDLLRKVEKQKVELEAGLPDESTAEIEVQLAGAEKAFDRHVKRGEALERIMGVTEKLTGEIRSGADGPFKELFTRLLKEMTSNKYGVAEMEEDLPVGIGEKEGQVVPHAYLSAGTKDTFSLALKLAMVKTFLQNREGFFILDDPLVDMDPERQKSAAAAISESAKDTQVILFTCHPSHAALFKEAEILNCGVYKE